jgi:phage shock protein A
MNKQFLQERINQLKEQAADKEKLIQQHIGDAQAIHGALQECTHHLSEVLKKEHEESLAKANKAEEDAKEQAKLQAGVDQYCDDVSKLGEV